MKDNEVINKGVVKVTKEGFMEVIEGDFLTGIGLYPKYIIIYKGDGTKDRHIPNFPPLGSTVVKMDKDGFTIENATDKDITYEVKVRG